MSPCLLNFSDAKSIKFTLFERIADCHVFCALHANRMTVLCEMSIMIERQLFFPPNIMSTFNSMKNIENMVDFNENTKFLFFFSIYVERKKDQYFYLKIFLHMKIQLMSVEKRNSTTQSICVLSILFAYYVFIAQFVREFISL